MLNKPSSNVAEGEAGTLQWWGNCLSAALEQGRGGGTAMWKTAAGWGGARASGLGGSSKGHEEDALVLSTGALLCWLLPHRTGVAVISITGSPVLWFGLQRWARKRLDIVMVVAGCLSVLPTKFRQLPVTESWDLGRNIHLILGKCRRNLKGEKMSGLYPCHTLKCNQ